MVFDVLTSPHRRAQTAPFSSVSQPVRKSSRNELGSWSTIFQRHHFLLTVLVVLAFLCTIYLYFAVTLGADTNLCSGVEGTEKELCHLSQAKSSILRQGKLKFF